MIADQPSEPARAIEWGCSTSHPERVRWHVILGPREHNPRTVLLACGRTVHRSRLHCETFTDTPEGSCRACVKSAHYLTAQDGAGPVPRVPPEQRRLQARIAWLQRQQRACEAQVQALEATVAQLIAWVGMPTEASACHDLASGRRVHDGGLR